MNSFSANDAGQPHKLRKRPTIGLMIDTLAYPYQQAIWQGVVDVSREYDVNLLCFPGGIVQSRNYFHIRRNVIYGLISPDTVDGLILASGAVGTEMTSIEMKTFYDRFHPLPMVSISESLDGIPSVLMDNYQGMHKLVTHLIETHGYRQIAYLRKFEGHPEDEMRYQAYLDVLAEHQLEFNPACVVSGDYYDDVSEGIRLLLDECQLIPGGNLDAIVAVDDFTARRVLEMFRLRGIRVPEDIALVGFDDEDGSQRVVPPLTTVRQPLYQQGRQAAELLLASLRGEEVPLQVMFPAELVIRQSCGCLNPTIRYAAAAPSRTVSNTADSCFINTLSMARERVLMDMIQSMDTQDRHDTPRNAVDDAAQILDGFVAEITGAAPANSFIALLKHVLQHTANEEGEVAAWHKGLSALRYHLLPLLDTCELVFRAENLCQQARVVIDELEERIKDFQAMQAQQLDRKLSDLEVILISTFDVDGLMDILAQQFPKLGMTSAYLVLYEHPSPFAGAFQPVPSGACLRLAYDTRRDVRLEPGGMLFPTRQMLPEGFFPAESNYCMVIQPLYFQDERQGFIMLEVGPNKGHIYESLRLWISNALQGAMLLETRGQAEEQLRKHHARLEELVKERNAQLVEERNLLRTLVDSLPDPVFIKDTKYRFLLVNTAMLQSTGIKHADAFLGCTDGDVFSFEIANRFALDDREVIETGRFLINKEYEEIDPQTGERRWMLSTKVPFRDAQGQIIGLLAIIRNVTQQKQAEQILRVSEQQYRALAEQVPDGIVILRRGKIVFTNAAFAAMVHTSQEEIILNDLLPFFQASDHAKILARFDTSQKTLRWEGRMIDREGDALWVEVEQSTLFWNGEPAVLLAIRNIEHQKLREMRLEDERNRLQQENLTLKSTIKDRYKFGEIIGKSTAMQRVYELVVSAAVSQINVLIWGESGTGKELIARTIHQVSSRKHQPYVTVNCASIPDTLFEREFFGHRKGSFTGAERDTPGLFDRAHQGTLFLDEVTELSQSNQAKLLRVLQDGEYKPLGSTVSRQADVLIISATNKDFQGQIEGGGLREDFFYRICVIEIHVPPLRQRREDIPLLIEHFLTLYRQKQQKIHGHVPDDLPAVISMLPGELVRAFYAHHWPGNIRELRNLLYRYLATKCMPSILSPLSAFQHVRERQSTVPNLTDETLKLSDMIREFEKTIIGDVWKQNRYNAKESAKMLGIPIRTLYNKLKLYELSKWEIS